MRPVRFARRTPRTAWNRGGFWAFIFTQFQGAYNDNLYRYIIFYYLLNKPGERTPETLTALGAILFSLPYILFPGIAGALSDRYSKRKIIVLTKFWEVGVMIFGLAAFLLDNEVFMWSMLFMMNMQSAFFSPSKYGILPEILPETHLSWGNGIMNMGTFIAIVTGTATAGLLFEWDLSIYTMSAILIGFSCLGFTSSLFVTSIPAADPARRIPWNPWKGLLASLIRFYRDQVLFLMIFVGSFFWFAGALIQQHIPIYAKEALQLDELHISLMIAFVGIGIAIGSIAAGYLSRRKIELGLVPIGMAGASLFTLLLAFHWGSLPWVIFLLAMVGFSSGFYMVPVNATVQRRSPIENKGEMVAAFNVINCGGILLAGVLYMGAGKLPEIGLAKFSPYEIFLIVSLMTLATGIYLCITFRMFLLRTIFWLLTNTLYRLRIKGAENLPEYGGAILVCRSSSCVDALILAASVDRPVRFLMAESLFGVPGLRILIAMLGLKPSGKRSERKNAANAAHFAAAADALEHGEFVCLFAQGIVSPSGEIIPFKEALDGILEEIEVPVVPVFIEPTRSQLFDIRDNAIRAKRPPRLPYPIAVVFHAAFEPGVTQFEIIRAMNDAGTEAYKERCWREPLLHRAFIRTARRHPFLMALADARTPHLSFLKALTGSIILGRKLRSKLGSQTNIGVLVPPSAGGVLTNVALSIMGRVPVNLNYTASPEIMAKCAHKAGVTHVITAHAFLERLPLEVPGEPVFLEDIMATVTKKDRIIGLLMALFCPIRRIERSLGSPSGRTENDLATIIFSSGSEGEPKGVMLTHFNVMANIDFLVKSIPNRMGEPVMGILPLFHSFGFTVVLWTPLIQALGVVLHPSPLEAKIIGTLIEKYKTVFLIATPTFLQNFVRRCSPENLRSLTCVITGAEKLPQRIRDAFAEKFGIIPGEGYGVTECAPTVSACIPNVNVPGYRFEGTRINSIGRPMPGISVRAVHTETGEELGPNEPGLLMIKSPCIMKGYLDMPERTAAVVCDGWYESGDIAAIDEDGFILLTDRLARFSKIGGEMVPHIRVEEALHTVLDLTEQSLAVAAVPDTSRGERLVVLHTLSDEQLESLVNNLDKTGLPNLWRPRPNAFYHIDAIPVLGTGKMDIKAIKALAQKLDVGE